MTISEQLTASELKNSTLAEELAALRRELGELKRSQSDDDTSQTNNNSNDSNTPATPPSDHTSLLLMKQLLSTKDTATETDRIKPFVKSGLENIMRPEIGRGPWKDLRAKLINLLMSNDYLFEFVLLEGKAKQIEIRSDIDDLGGSLGMTCPVSDPMARFRARRFIDQHLVSGDWKSLFEDVVSSGQCLSGTQRTI
jgi:hypothetical protein